MSASLSHSPSQHAQPRFVVRPSRESDIDGLLALVETIPDSLTSLPRNRKFIEDRVRDSLRAFHPHIKRPGAEHYLFVLERLDPFTRLVGCSGLVARVGGFDPFYTYEITHERFVHVPLGVDKEKAVLRLRSNHKGPSELCSLLLAPSERGGGAGRLLSLARLHFIAAHRVRFADTLIAELRGRLDEHGRSPFWEAVGRHFFARDFYEADQLSGLGEKDFIRDLMPRHPIYLDLLPESARDSIGAVHRDTEPALALLLGEGLNRTSEVDIFDAGPLVAGRMDDLRTLRALKRASFSSEAPSAPAPLALVSNGRLDFRAALAAIETKPGGSVSLCSAAALALEVRPGDNILFSPLK